MGLVRWLLAIAVLVAHSEKIEGLAFLSPSEAVRTFFMVSGFYMTLILNKKYLNLENGYKLFVTNRFLRLYPIYWIVFVGTLAMSLFGHAFFNEPYLFKSFLDESQHLNLIGWVVVIASNLIIFLQSTLSFFDFYNGQIFQVHANPLGVPGSNFLLVPQAWSIGLELSFYAVAPFFVGRSWRAIALVTAGCVGIMTAAFGLGLTFGPWGQRFFISGLAHFACGALTYKLYERFFHRIYSKPLALFLLIAWIATTVWNTLLPDPGGLRYWAYFTQSFFSIPFVFELSKNWKWDRFVGEFSYPVYMSHYAIVAVVSFVVGRFGLPHTLMGEVALVTTMFVSFLLLRFVSIPIDRIREDRVVRGNRKSPEVETDALNSKLAKQGELKGVTNADKQV